MIYNSKTDTLGENVGYQAILIQQQVLDADDARIGHYHPILGLLKNTINVWLVY